ncbi:MAG: hypothetical protein BWK76_03925 [Desulfobulbaceae bacterium A2]|nr:MAG: hypothetical protein BWK76_03925 [Desulfobulbaceae bacterium A2]
MSLSFRESLGRPGQFTLTYELVPGQGSGSRQVERLLAFVLRAQADGRIKALSITDNAGGHPSLAPSSIGADVQALGLEPLVHFSLKDKNRNQIESHIFFYHRQGFHSLLVMGGDYPGRGYHGQAKPVFDLDSVQTLQLFHDLEQGQYRSGSSIQQELSALSFFRGCVVSPFKIGQAEQLWQYGKLLRKIRAGAQFIVTQLGYDLRKFDELLRFLRQAGIETPVLANVFIPNLTVARLMSRGQVPGIVFPPALLRAMEDEAQAGRANEARLQRASMMIATLRSMGYAGVHLGGNGLDFDKVARVMDMAEAMHGNWRDLGREAHFPVPGTFYLYEDDPAGGNGPQPRPLRPPSGPGPAWYFNHALHGLLFEEDNPCGRGLGRLCRHAYGRPRLTRLLILLELLSKVPLFGCHLCGDCTLSESAYLCPQSGCPKRLVNGPCGGSREGRCEVHPERPCFWVRVYECGRRPADAAELGQAPSLPPKDWSLSRGSSWINFFTGRDHRKKLINSNLGKDLSNML